MKHIKLDAIDSTNDFLKSLSNSQVLQNFTVVTAKNQLKGRGQMGSIWSSESGKNLIMSVLVADFLSNIDQIFTINIVVSVTIMQVLEDLNIPELSIKWPNDIMSYNKKLGGILIENSIKNDKSIHSVVGLGLNINQFNFENLPKATSLALICNTTFDIDEILLKIVQKLKQNIENWNQNAHLFWSEYATKLFKKGIPMPFSDENQQKFMGIIQGVSFTGKLQILLEDNSISEFSIKEIRMLY